jgi:hypothetical protein
VGKPSGVRHEPRGSSDERELSIGARTGGLDNPILL